MTDEIKPVDEKIDLQYLVKFDDGLKPELIVLAIDELKKKLYADQIYFAVTNRVGLDLNDKCYADIKGYHTKAHPFAAIEEDSSDLDKLLQDARNNEVCVVKVDSVEHFKVAVDHYANLYTYQFEELLKEQFDLFLKCVKEHPGYFGKRLSKVILKKHEIKQ
jgi:Ribonuclease G/E